MSRPARRCAARVVLSGIVLLLLTAAAVSAQPAAVPARRWQIEVTGAQAVLSPAGLDSLVAYETAIVDHLRTQQVQQTHEGDLRKLNRAFPVGARVVRTMGRRWSVGAGFSWFDTSRRSSAKASYDYTVVNAGAQEYQRTFSETIAIDPLALTAREYFTHAVVRYEWIAGPRFGLGTSLHAGWLAAECRVERARTVAGGFYPINRASRVNLTGRGDGPAGDALLTARVSVTRRLGLLAETGYAWHVIRKVTGSSSTASTTQDGEATQVELAQTSQAEGRWINQPVEYQTGSGVWRGTAPAIGVEGSPFRLDLSGWRFRLGVSLGL
jgi:hypothetical protein